MRMMFIQVAIWRVGNILKLSNYCYLEALPASRLDIGDVDELE
jgi:hypothetical protein